MTAPALDWRRISRHADPADSPGFLLWRVGVEWRRAVEAVLAPLGLTHPQFVVLASIGWLAREGAPPSQAALGRQVGLDPNTMSQILRGLERRRLIERRHRIDERAKQPLLTAAGAALASRALPAVEAADAAFFAAAGKGQRRLVAGLARLLPALAG